MSKTQLLNGGTMACRTAQDMSSLSSRTPTFQKSRAGSRAGSPNPPNPGPAGRAQKGFVFALVALALLLQCSTIVAVAFAILSLTVFYWNICCRPRLVVGMKVASIVAKVGALHRRLNITPWAMVSHMQCTLFIIWPLMSYKGRRAIHFQREMLQLRDGGDVALDWICLDGASPPPADYRGVIVLQLPGIVGKYSNKYLPRFVQYSGFPCVVKSWRGIGCDLSSARPETWDPHAVKDTMEVGTYLRRAYPHAKLVIMGWSHGGNVALCALAQGQHLFDAGILVSAPSDLSVAIPAVEQVRFPYAYVNTFSIYQNISEEVNRQVITRADPLMDERLKVAKDAMKWGNLLTHVFWARQPFGFMYHDLVTRRYTKHDSVPEYYQTLGDMVEYAMPRVAVPTLCLFAEDDPVTPICSFSKYLHLASAYMVFAVTPKGGHCGWFCGLKGLSWINEVASEFCEASARECS